jgi:hypothetical protein
MATLSGVRGPSRLRFFGCCRREGFHQLHVLLQRVAQRRAGQLGHAQLVAVAPARFLARCLDRLGMRLQAHDGLREGASGLPVDACMVNFRIHRDLAALQPVDHVELPQRAAAVHQRGVQAAHVLLELAQRAGPRQRDAAHVVVEVHVLVLHPHGVRQLEGHQRELAREDLRQVHAARHVRLHILVVVALVVRRQLQQVQAAHMHRRLGCLGVQEGRVQAAQVFHSDGSRVVVRAWCAMGSEGK